MFTENRVIAIDNEDGEIDEDQMMEDALESGCSDFQAEGEAFEIYTDPADFSAVVAALEEKGYTFVSADVEQVPDTYSSIDDEEAAVKMQKLLDMLEDNDDVQNVFHNWENAE